VSAAHRYAHLPAKMALSLCAKGDIHFVAVTAWRWGFQLLPPMIAL